MSDSPTHDIRTHDIRTGDPRTDASQHHETAREAGHGRLNGVELAGDPDAPGAGRERTSQTDHAAFSTELDSYLASASMEGLGDRLLARLRERDATPADSGLTGNDHDDHSHRAPELDVVWTTHDSAIGPLLLAFRGPAVIRVAFESEGFDAVIDALGERLGRRTLRAAHPAGELRRQLDAYLTGERTTIDVPFDLALSSAPFRREVQQSLPMIAYGTTASYGEVAASAGRPKAVRAVGSACATNPLPIVLPCHRVLRSDGSLGQYLGGVETKKFLLAHERSHAASRR